MKTQLQIQTQIEGLEALTEQIIELLTEHRKKLLTFDLECQGMDCLLDLVLTAEFMTLLFVAPDCQVPPITVELVQKMDKLTLN